MGFVLELLQMKQTLKSVSRCAYTDQTETDGIEISLCLCLGFGAMYNCSAP